MFRRAPLGVFSSDTELSGRFLRSWDLEEGVDSFVEDESREVLTELKSDSLLFTAEPGGSGSISDS